MAISLVQTATQVQVDATSLTSFNITINGTANSNVLTAFYSAYDALLFTVSSVSDGGNSWTTRTGTASGTDRTSGIISYASNITGGNRTVTIALGNTSPGSNRYITYGAQEWSGVATSSPEDTWDENSEIDITSSDVTAGPITTTEADDLLVGIATGNVTVTMSYGSPTSWTNSYRENDGFSHASYDVSYWLPGATQTTYSPQWSHANQSSRKGTAVVVALKPISGIPVAWVTA